MIGIDASAAGMAESSLRAARPQRKGGLPNTLFVVAAAERPPEELIGIADEVTVLFPWGSLLRGALARDDARDEAAGIAALAAPGGLVTILISIDARDHLDLPPIDSAARADLAARWARHGLRLTAFDQAGPAEVDAMGSSWARRLAAGRDRTAWRLELRAATTQSIRPSGTTAAAREPRS